MSNKNKNVIDLERRIIKFLTKNQNNSFNYKQISSAILLDKSIDKSSVIKSLNKLFNLKKIEQKTEGKFSYLKVNISYEEGIIDITSSGNGYLLKEGNDIFISKKHINRALNKDIVKVYVYNRKNKNDSISGEVVEIIKRHKNEYVGILKKQKEFGFVLTRGSKMYTDIFLSSKEMNKAKDGQKVIVKIKDWPKKAQSPYGEIIDILGEPGNIDVEMHAILYDYGLPYKFPKDIIEKAELIDKNIEKKQIDKRKDIRNILTFTIDPITAKDFDDAISFKEINKDKFEIGIHIADVSHYVKENTIIDDEAYKRATSVYLVDRVVPMLPEILSNNLCSLRPNEEKYTFSAIFEIDKKGEILSEWFGKTVIKSDHRFSYEEVQEIIETQKGFVSKEISLEKKEYSISNKILEAILCLNNIALIMREKRLLSGALSFDRVEVGFNLNKNNEPESIKLKTSKEANKLVEEFMLLANKKVAGFIERKKEKLPFVYRVHDEPNQEKIKNLKDVVGSFGYRLDTEENKINNSLNKLLTNIKGRPEQNMIDTLTLRCMSKAIYTTNNIGHYGLAFESYSHFTSPIRRYPDVLTHRLLEHYLNKGKAVNKDTLEEACTHSSQREQLATKAERDSIKYMQIKYMEDKIGRNFQGIISGITDRGIYVEINENKCEGMVSVKSIDDDQYFYNQKKHQLEGFKTKQIFKLGDQIQIKVKKADILNRHLDFTLLN
tara:strand:- start:49154 stop:51313 length:2160 start_codon:yes stop_codon:yes gene_type:complete